METAYIFDFDGVLVNTMEAHFAAYSAALEEAGVPIDREQFYYQAGMTGREQIAWFCRKACADRDPDEIYRRKGELAPRFMHLIKPIGSNIDLFKTLHKAGFRLAIASGSSKGSIVPTARRFGIEADVIVSAEDVERGKPHPDLFLRAAAELGADPAHCVVVEDSPVGLEAARAAGMMCFMFYSH